MLMLDVVNQLRLVLPKYTGVFSDALTVLSITASEGTVTIVTDGDHNLVDGQLVSINDVQTQTPISGYSADGFVYTFETGSAHDLTLGWPEHAQVILTGFTDAAWNDAFTLLDVPNRQSFKVQSTKTAPTLNGNEKLLEVRIDGPNGAYEVTVIDSTSFSITDGVVDLGSLSYTIDHTKISSALIDFPVGITITGTEFMQQRTADDWQNLHITVSGVECYTEVSDWDIDNDTAVLWVKVPYISSSVDTEISIEMGGNNTTYVGETGDSPAQSVWSDYDAIYHMSQDPSDPAPQIIDSTPNGYDLTSNGAMTTDDLIITSFGRGIDFDGNDDYLIGTGFQYGLTSTTVIKFHLDALPTATEILVHQGDNTVGGNQGLKIYITSAGTVKLSYLTSIWRHIESALTVSTGDNIVMIALGTTVEDCVFSVNGSTETITVQADYTNSTYPLHIGVQKDASYITPFSGIIDELFMLEGLYSSAEMGAMYNALSKDLFIAADVSYIGGTVSPSARIAGAVDIDRAIEQYTAQGLTDVWGFVAMHDGEISKDRTTDSDATSTPGTGDALRLRLIDGFSLFLVVNTTEDIAAQDAVDLCRHTLMLPILKSVYGARFASGLSAGPDFKIVFTGHAFVSYNAAVYVHVYNFELSMDLTESDAVEPEDTRAYRDINFSQTINGSDEMTAVIDLDEDPIAP